MLNALAGNGPFVSQLRADNIFWLQMFLIVLYLPLLLLTSLFEERFEKIQILGETENRFRNLADAAPIMIWVSSTDKLCSFFSKGWLDFTGRTLEQELGNGWSEGVHPDDRDRCLRTYVESFALMVNIDGSSITVSRASGPTASSSGIWVLPLI